MRDDFEFIKIPHANFECAWDAINRKVQLPEHNLSFLIINNQINKDKFLIFNKVHIKTTKAYQIVSDLTLE